MPEIYSKIEEIFLFYFLLPMRDFTLMTASFNESHLKLEFKFVCKLRPIPSMTIKSTLYKIIKSNSFLQEKSEHSVI